MNRTLIAVFDSPDHARMARDELLQLGVSESSINVHASRSDEGDAQGFTSSMSNRFGLDDDDAASQYEEAIRHGSCVVAVDAIGDDLIARASRIMSEHGAIDMNERVADWRAGMGAGTDDGARSFAGEDATLRDTAYTGRAGLGTSSGSRQMAADSGARGGQMGDPTFAQGAGQTGAALAGQGGQMSGQMAGEASVRGSAQGEAGRIPVVEEQIDIGKREVEQGRVRVFTRVSERPVEEQVSLREEHARIERHPVDRELTGAEADAAFKEQSLEIRESAERPVVRKSARVVEEVEVGKEATERTETVQDTVRRTDVEVENDPTSRSTDNIRGSETKRRR